MAGENGGSNFKWAPINLQPSRIYDNIWTEKLLQRPSGTAAEESDMGHCKSELMPAKIAD